MKLVFLHGLPAVGKLTVGRELEPLTGYPLFHNHLAVDLLTTVFEFGSPGFVELRERIWLDVFERAASDGLPGLLFTFAAERTVRPDFVDRVVAAVSGAGGEVVFVELHCEPDELRRRVERPERREFGKLASAELLDELLEKGVLFDLQVPSGATSWSFDTTATPPAETARAIADRLDASGA